ncbi:FAD/NAD(P)-binding domain-containing protein [Podospora appendiculata]|uniref:FAD/NAD(P)-binding domain-containing protein n=1 Tax=Podospora appendiculata TaxID=314037 RepID=A0AAE0X5W9_9PEZI|nr:FAD/NAD(P)-binding domain-containing protein [Podospora appendiculata]
MGSQAPGRFAVRRIAVIGAGPCGLASAKYLLAQRAFESITIYEQQYEVGGVWNYSPVPSQTLHVPQVSASCPPDPPLQPKETPPVFPTPMYEVLHTNIPRALMRFSDAPFPQDSLIFPSREVVQAYLVDYAKDIRHLIKFSTQVEDIRVRQDDDGRDQWDVDVVSLETGQTATITYDAVVVASGHYSAPYLPEVRNIKQFHEAHPGVITHSKLYRTPEPFTNKKVLVVGNSASGLDIAAQISRVCQRPLLLSVQTATPPANLAHVGAEEVSVIEEFLVDERGVKFRDGRVEKNIDAVVFSTGYLFTFPFLASLKPPLVTDGRRVCGLYQHLFSINHPTMVFSGLPIKVVPFPISESQAAVVARTWANLLPLPSADEMKKWEEDEAEKRGPSFHVWPKGADAEYINSVHDWLQQPGAVGKEPPHWDEEQVWERQIYFEAKLKFEMEGRTAHSLAELGFISVDARSRMSSSLI